MAEKLFQFPVLAVGQCVHRVDHDGRDALARAVSKDMVNDGNDIGQALTRAGASGEHVVMPLPRESNRFLLMSM